MAAGDFAPGSARPLTDAEYWEQWRVLQQAATDAAREVNECASTDPKQEPS
jgi:hypothetical protein